MVERAGGRCEVCGHSLRVGGQVHHRMRRGHEANDVPSNCLHVCDGCHRMIHAAPTHSRNEGWIVSSNVRHAGIKPAEIPVRFWDGTKQFLWDDGSYSETEWQGETDE